MVAKQLSVFLENKSGRLTEVTQVLGQSGVIVSDPDKAYKVLKDAHFAVKVTDVIGFSCPNTSGSLSTVLKYLSDSGVFIEYMYSFANGVSANVIIRPTNIEFCEKILSEKKVDLIAASDLYKL